MASSINSDLMENYEKWLKEKLESSVNDPNSDLLVVLNFIISTVSDDETSDEEKKESIVPFLQELNQVNHNIRLYSSFIYLIVSILERFRI